ncbi:MAG: glycoside hydrolase family 88 protein [Clostridia bacterium]|nr:glycoside hydrolase family 88 protein [Clostridia bacterium]
MTARELAILSCETMMKKFEAKDLPPIRKFHYHQGVFLSGMLHTYHLTGDERYYQYAKDWVDSLLGEDGLPCDMDTTALDDLQPGILLYEMYEKSGDDRYKRILDKIIYHIDRWPKSEEGGFFHKDNGRSANMWLDGMYMGGPVTVEYGVRFNRTDLFDEVHKQMSLMRDRITDNETGLMYHAYDQTKKAVWADKETGRAPHFWGRAMGWYAVAMFEIAELLPKSYAKREEFIEKGKELLEALFKYQDEKTGLWYQVIDKTRDAENWHETSCSCLFLYALCMAIRMGVFEKNKVQSIAVKAFEGIKTKLIFGEDNYLGVGGVCIGTGVGDLPHYYGRPRSENDLHGVGAFLLMACEYSAVFDNE